MNKNQIIQFIKSHLNSNYSGKQFYKMQFNDKECFDKYLDNDINLVSLKLVSSGIVDFKSLLPSLEVIANLNKFNKDNLSIDITLRNSDNSIISPIHIGLRDYQLITNEQLKEIIDEKLFEVYDLDFCKNELIKFNYSFNEDFVVALHQKLAVLNHKFNQETISDLDKKQLDLLINYYNEILNDFIFKNNLIR